MKELVGTFNQEKALVGGFSVIAKSDGSFAALIPAHLVEQQTGPGELPGHGVPVLPAGHPRGLPRAAGLAGLPHQLLAAAALGPRHELDQ